MDRIIWPEYLYTYLKLIEGSSLEKKILDCGAGGKYPPLTLFNRRGFQTYGIDISKESLDASLNFATENNLKLDMRIGDMRNIPFEDESFSFVFTQNSICHLNKEDTKKAISEMLRVVVPGGICFIDFMSIECSFCNEDEMGTMVGDYEFLKKERDEDFLHSFYSDDEAENLFSNVKILRKDKIYTDFLTNEPPYTFVRIIYYVQKPV